MISKQELDLLTDQLSDLEIARRFSVTKQTVRNWRLTLSVKSFSEKTGLIRRGGLSIDRSQHMLLTSPHLNVENLKKGSEPITEGHVTFFDSINLPEKAYYLGLLATDGYVNGNKRTVSIALKKEDDYLLHHLKQISNWPTDVKPKKHAWPQSVINLSSKHLVQTLSGWGFTPKKSRTFKLFKTVPQQYQSDFVRGVWDGDGWVGERQFSLVTASEEFIYQVRQIIFDNTGCDLTVCRPTDRNHLVLSGGRKTANALLWIYSNTFPSLERKVIQVSRFWK